MLILILSLDLGILGSGALFLLGGICPYKCPRRQAGRLLRRREGPRDGHAHMERVHGPHAYRRLDGQCASSPRESAARSGRRTRSAGRPLDDAQLRFPGEEVQRHGNRDLGMLPWRSALEPSFPTVNIPLRLAGMLLRVRLRLSSPLASSLDPLPSLNGSGERGKPGGFPRQWIQKDE